MPETGDFSHAFRYDGPMHDQTRHTERLGSDRLREIGQLLRSAFALPDADVPVGLGQLSTADMLLALDSSELREIMGEIMALHHEQVRRLERLLSRHADNDTE